MLCCVRYFSAKILVGSGFSSSLDNRGRSIRERTVDLGLLPYMDSDSYLVVVGGSIQITIVSIPSRYRYQIDTSLLGSILYFKFRSCLQCCGFGKEETVGHRTRRSCVSTEQAHFAPPPPLVFRCCAITRVT